MAAFLLNERLPQYWTYGVTQDGRIFFINDRRGITTWLHPETGRPVQTGHFTETDLPPGWEQGVTPEGAIYYIDHNTWTTSFDHPLTWQKDSGYPPESVSVESPSSPKTSPFENRQTQQRKSSKQKVLDKAPSGKRSRHSTVTKRAWLYKQETAPLKSWKKRWCVLADFCLFFYKDDNEKGETGSILLPSYTVSLCSLRDGINRRFSFKIEHENMKTYYLATDNQEELDGWTRAIHLATIAQVDIARQDLGKEYERNNNYKPADYSPHGPYPGDDHHQPQSPNLGDSRHHDPYPGDGQHIPRDHPYDDQQNWPQSSSFEGSRPKREQEPSFEGHDNHGFPHGQTPFPKDSYPRQHLGHDNVGEGSRHSQSQRDSYSSHPHSGHTSNADVSQLSPGSNRHNRPLHPHQSNSNLDNSRLSYTSDRLGNHPSDKYSRPGYDNQSDPDGHSRPQVRDSYNNPQPSVDPRQSYSESERGQQTRPGYEDDPHIRNNFSNPQFGERGMGTGYPDVSSAPNLRTSYTDPQTENPQLRNSNRDLNRDPRRSRSNLENDRHAVQGYPSASMDRESQASYTGSERDRQMKSGYSASDRTPAVHGSYTGSDQPHDSRVSHGGLGSDRHYPQQPSDPRTSYLGPERPNAPRTSYAGSERPNDPRSSYAGLERPNDPRTSHARSERDRFDDPIMNYTGSERPNDPRTSFAGSERDRHNDPRTKYSGSQRERPNDSRTSFAGSENYRFEDLRNRSNDPRTSFAGSERERDRFDDPRNRPNDPRTSYAGSEGNRHNNSRTSHSGLERDRFEDSRNLLNDTRTSFAGSDRGGFENLRNHSTDPRTSYTESERDKILQRGSHKDLPQLGDYATVNKVRNYPENGRDSSINYRDSNKDLPVRTDYGDPDRDLRPLEHHRSNPEQGYQRDSQIYAVPHRKSKPDTLSPGGSDSSNSPTRKNPGLTVSPPSSMNNYMNLSAEIPDRPPTIWNDQTLLRPPLPVELRQQIAEELAQSKTPHTQQDMLIAAENEQIRRQNPNFFQYPPPMFPPREPVLPKREPLQRLDNRGQNLQPDSRHHRPEELDPYSARVYGEQPQSEPYPGGRGSGSGYGSVGSPHRHRSHQDRLPIHTVKEDPDMPDSDILETKNILPRYPINGTRLRLSLNAENLLGKSHEELVLLLIQLRRNKSGLEFARDYYRQQIEKHRASEQEYRRRSGEGVATDPGLEHGHMRYAELKRQCDEIEKKLEVYRPLINLVDNMVTMGSLYGGDNYMLATQYKKHLLRPDQYTAPKRMLEFSRQHQEDRMIQEIEDEIKQLSHEEVDLEEKMERLYELDRAMLEQSSMVTSLKEDKDLLERTLEDIHKQQDEQRNNPRELDRLARQQREMERELSRVMHQLADASKLLEETTAENNKVERDVALLRSRVHGELTRSKSAPSLTSDSYKARLKLEKDLAKVQDMMSGLNQQGAKLSQAMNTIRRSSSNAGLTAALKDQESSPKEKTSTYNETDLDSAVTMDIGTSVSSPGDSHAHSYREEDNLYPPTYTQVHKQGTAPGPNYENQSFYEAMDNSDAPDTRNMSHDLAQFRPIKEVQAEPSFEQLESERPCYHHCYERSELAAMPGEDCMDYSPSQSDPHRWNSAPQLNQPQHRHQPSFHHEDPPIHEEEKGDMPWDINEADDNTKRFFGIIPKEKPKLLTVRDVKRQAGQRRERDKFRHGAEDDGLDTDTADCPESGLEGAYSDWQERGQSQGVYQDAERGGLFTATMARAMPVGQSSSSLPLYENIGGSDDDGSVTNNNTVQTGHEPRARRNTSITSLPSRLLGPKPFTPYQETSSQSMNRDYIEGYKPSSTFITRPVTADLVTSSTSALYTSKPFSRDSSGLPTAVVKVKKSPRRGARYLTISSSRPLTLETPTVKADIMDTAAGDLIRPVDMVPDIVRSSTTNTDLFDELAIERDILGLPEKVHIPERYVPDSDDEELTKEEKRWRQERSDRIRRVLTNQSIQDLSKAEIGEIGEGDQVHEQVQRQKRARDHLLELNQQLARQVTLKSRQAAEQKLKGKNSGMAGSPLSAPAPHGSSTDHASSKRDHHKGANHQQDGLPVKPERVKNRVDHKLAFLLGELDSLQTK